MRWVSCLSFALTLVLVVSVRDVHSQEKKAAKKKDVEEKAKEEKAELKDVPKAVIDAVKKRFPNGELTEAAKEEEDGQTIYEVSVKQDGKKSTSASRQMARLR